MSRHWISKFPWLCLALSGAHTADAQEIVRIVATNYVFAAPDTITAGLVIFDFVNRSTEAHEALLKRVRPGDDVKAMLASANGGIPAGMEAAGGPDIVDPGVNARSMQYMKPGTYVWFCVVKAPDGQSHSAKGMTRVMVARPPRASGSASGGRPTKEPDTKSEIRLKDFSFAIDNPLQSGAQWVKVSNEGTKAHEVVVFRLAPGKTLADMKAWQKTRNGPIPFTRIGGLAGIEHGEHAFIRFDGAPGNYVLRCRILDTGSGRTHIQLGMEMELTVN